MASSIGEEKKNKTVVLVSSDRKKFEVPIVVASQAKILNYMIEEEDCIDNPFPLDNVTSSVLTKIIEYCSKHVENSIEDEHELKAWDAEFINVDQSILFSYIMEANYLEIPELLELGCEQVASMIRGKTPEEIRRTFNIKNDFTPEEEEEITRENAWALD